MPDINPISNPDDILREAAAAAPTRPQTPPSTDTSSTPPPFVPSAVHPDPKAVVTQKSSVATADQQPRVRVASRVPSLQVYAILVLIFAGLMTCLALVALFSLSVPSSPRTGEISLLHPLMLYAVLIGFLISALQGAFAIYLLLSKSPKVVSIVILCILIFTGLGILNTILSILKAPNGSTGLSLMFSVALWAFLFSVRSKVESLKRADNLNS